MENALLQHDAVQAQTMASCGVRLSVTFVHSVKINKISSNFFPPSDSHTILLFPHQTSQQYSNGNPTNVGVECRWGRQNSQFPTSIWLYHVLSTLWLLGVINTARCYQHYSAGPWQVVTLIAGSKRWRLLTTGDNNEMFMTRSLNIMPKTTEQHLIARSDKSVAYVTNYKRLRSILCTIKANYWQTLSIA